MLKLMRWKKLLGFLCSAFYCKASSYQLNFFSKAFTMESILLAILSNDNTARAIAERQFAEFKQNFPRDVGNTFINRTPIIWCTYCVQCTVISLTTRSIYVSFLLQVLSQLSAVLNSSSNESYRSLSAILLRGIVLREPHLWGCLTCEEVSESKWSISSAVFTSFCLCINRCKYFKFPVILFSNYLLHQVGNLNPKMSNYFCHFFPLDM